jgi:hypothetical protein
MTFPLAKTSSLRVVAFVAFVAAAACGRDKVADRAAADSALARDLALAGQQTSAAPTFQDTTIAPAPQPAPATQQKRSVEREPTPKRRAPEARRPAPIPERVAQTPPPQPQPQAVNAVPAPTPAPIAGPAIAPAEIGAGANFGLTSGSKVCSSTNLPGDKLVATLTEPVSGTNGAMIPAGSTVVLEVASVTSGASADAAQVVFRVRSVVVNDKTYTVDASIAPATALEKSKVSDPNATSDKTKVIGGAIAGAILGQMIGHNTKGTVIGAAAGAATGAAIAKGGEKWQACLPAGSPLRLTLNAPLVISS